MRYCIVILLLLFGCSNSDQSPSIVGVWYRLNAAGDRVYRLTFNSDKSYSGSEYKKDGTDISSGGIKSNDDSGDYVYDGSTLTLNSTSSGTNGQTAHTTTVTTSYSVKSITTSSLEFNDWAAFSKTNPQ